MSETIIYCSNDAWMKRNLVKNKDQQNQLFKSLISSHYGIAKSLCCQQITQVPTKSQHLCQFQHLLIISICCDPSCFTAQ